MQTYSMAHANEVNNKGESLLVAVIRYVMEPHLQVCESSCLPFLCRQIRCMSLLHRLGADVNYQTSNKMRQTALIVAITLKQVHCVQYLLSWVRTSFN